MVVEVGLLLLEQGEEEFAAVRGRERRRVSSTAGHWGGDGLGG